MDKMLDKQIWINKTINLLGKNPDKIHWDMLSFNPNAMHLLEKNQDKLNWGFLSDNPNAIDLLEKNQDKIDWHYLSMNKGYYGLNYKFLKERMDIIREDLMKAVYHPKRLEYYLNLGYDIFDE